MLKVFPWNGAMQDARKSEERCFVRAPMSPVCKVECVCQVRRKYQMQPRDAKSGSRKIRSDSRTESIVGRAEARSSIKLSMKSCSSFSGKRVQEKTIL